LKIYDTQDSRFGECGWEISASKGFRGIFGQIVGTIDCGLIDINLGIDIDYIRYAHLVGTSRTHGMAWQARSGVGRHSRSEPSGAATTVGGPAPVEVDDRRQTIAHRHSRHAADPVPAA